MENGTRVLRIDGMYDAECERRVRAALRGVPGVGTESVRVGRATIRCDGRAASAAACAAVNSAGFKAWETRPLPRVNLRLSDAPTSSAAAMSPPDAPALSLPAADRTGT